MQTVFQIKRNGLKKSFCFLGKELFSWKTYLSHIHKNIQTLHETFLLTLSPRSIPVATGTLRDIQLALLNVLKEIHKVCDLNDLTYWIDFGTLLGAVRHGGFIPWDDDIDISMPRKDYQRFVEIFNARSTDINLKAVYYSHHTGKCNIIKVIHTQMPHVFIDIFPIDYCDRVMNDREKLTFSEELKRLICIHVKKKKQYDDILKWHDSFAEVRKHIVGSQESETQAFSIFYGPEFLHETHLYNVFDRETIFPLTKVQFEGNTFFAPNDSDKYLTYIFGDYMSLPKHLHAHIDVRKISLEEKMKLKSYTKKERKKVVITYGTFDVLHYGHIHLLKRAKELGDYLIVGLSTDEFNKMKNKTSFYTYEERKSILEACKYVDLIIPEEQWDQKIKDIQKYQATIFTIGDDWKGQFDFLEPYVQVVYLPRTPDVSSTKTKEYCQSKKK